MTSDVLKQSPDLRGLAVHDADNLPVGSVYGVLTEAATGLVRFLDVELDSPRRHVIVPIGHARIVEMFGRPRVQLRAATLDDLQVVPSYDQQNVWEDSEYRNEVVGAFGRLFRGDRYYAHPAYDHSGLYAGNHPIIRTRPADSGAPTGLSRLSERDDLQIASGYPDVREWRLDAADGEPAGIITDLLVDPQALAVRYLVVRRADDSETLIPIGYVELDEAHRCLAMPGLTARDIEALPAWDGKVLTRADEDLIRQMIDAELDARNPFYRVEYNGRAVVSQA